MCNRIKNSRQWPTYVDWNLKIMQTNDLLLDNSLAIIKILID